MQIVIDIPDNDYRQIKEYYEKNDTVEATYSYIYHGTPLPKGHGKIGDLDKLYAIFDRNVVGANAYKPLFDAIDSIIEADKEGEEK